MDIYSKKSRWKIWLAIVGIIIVVISMVYTNFLASKMEENEENKVQLFIMAQESLANSRPDQDLTYPLEVIKRSGDIPMIIVNDREKVESGLNFGDDKDTSLSYLESELKALKATGKEPIVHSQLGETQYIYFKESRLLKWLTYFPIIQILLLLAFIGVGYAGFSSARKAEQNRVWVGMAKETAHQLGTPISAIMGWIEYLEETKKDDGQTLEVVGELSKDVERLNLIADRFSKIGSEPELQATNLFAELNKSGKYMEKRSPRKVDIHYPSADQILDVQINPPLFNWVTENLLRNALDALNGVGTIDIQVQKVEGIAEVHITDSGAGIPASKHKTVFQPGFTTKKRGWGLGLSLAKRIIEEYHNGKIFVKSSAPGAGTTFCIQLPLN